MTAEYRGASDVARWCGVGRAAVSNWVNRHPDEIPQPDVIVVNSGGKGPVRGWLPERQGEWEAFAAKRKRNNDPAEVQNRAARTADLIEEGVQAGRIDPGEAVKLLRELIGRKP